MFAKAQPALSEESCVRESFVSGVHGKTCGCVRTVVLEESPVGFVQVSLSGLCSRESFAGCVRQKPYWLSLKKCLKRALAVSPDFARVSFGLSGVFRVIECFSGYFCGQICCPIKAKAAFYLLMKNNCVSGVEKQYFADCF
ncbi:hypothetical protein BBC0178_016610 [Bartonella apihabitans]|uniref:Uncharacterized protein n=2 Tax=Bartonella apihabitans TaxID=2750929 RepID=A0A1U9MCW1_9HYPH|nr:hypothetical protein BBC0178_016610 [Bartonella apihabitans]